MDRSGIMSVNGRRQTDGHEKNQVTKNKSRRRDDRGQILRVPPLRPATDVAPLAATGQARDGSRETKKPERKQAFEMGVPMRDVQGLETGERG